MVMMPKKTKHRKQQKGSFKGLTKGADTVDFGEFGMKALDRCWITNKQIEAARVAITRVIGKKAQAWIRIFPDKPVSKKPAETRMGKGKGSPDQWVAVVKPGRILFEVANISKEKAQLALRKAEAKLPVKTKFVERVQEV